MTETRSELEINLSWARSHPALFVTSITEWAAKYPKAAHRVDFGREGFMTLIAYPPDALLGPVVYFVVGQDRDGRGVPPEVFRGAGATQAAEAAAAELLELDGTPVVYRGVEQNFHSKRAVTVRISGDA